MCALLVFPPDGILNHENEEIRDRVAVLERKVQQQEDEIICLKSALSDCIRKLSAFESGRGRDHSDKTRRNMVKLWSPYHDI